MDGACEYKFNHDRCVRAAQYILFSVHTCTSGKISVQYSAIYSGKTWAKPTPTKMRGTGHCWQRLRVPGVPTLAQGLRMASDMDLGADGNWHRNRKGPGDGKTCAVLQCNAHEQCGKLLRVVFNKDDGDYIFEEAGAHSQATKKKRRLNAALSLEQEKEAKFGIATGQLRPAGIVLGMTTAMEQEYMKKNIDPLSMKRTNGGLIGKSPRGKNKCTAAPVLGVC